MARRHHYRRRDKQPAELDVTTYLNLMAQYRPCYKASRCADIDRPVLENEYRQALASARRHGMTRLDPRAPRAFVGRLAGVV